MEKEKIYFEMLESDITCEKKNLSYGLDDRPFHNHDGYEALFLMSGKALVKTKEAKRELLPGDLVLFHSGTLHHGEPTDCRIYDRVVLNVKESVVRKCMEKKPSLSKTVGFQAGDSSGIFHFTPKEADEFMECSDNLSAALKDKDFGADVLADAFMNRIFVLLGRAASEAIDAGLHEEANERKDLVRMLIAFIDIHISDDLSLSKLEKLFLYSGPYLSRCFKEITGLSIQNYIIKKRVCLAKKLIEGGMDMQSVCDTAGFGNYSNFSRTFLQYTGFSPKAFRQTIQ